MHSETNLRRREPSFLKRSLIVSIIAVSSAVLLFALTHLTSFSESDNQEVHFIEGFARTAPTLDRKMVPRWPDIPVRICVLKKNGDEKTWKFLSRFLDFLAKEFAYVGSTTWVKSLSKCSDEAIVVVFGANGDTEELRKEILHLGLDMDDLPLFKRKNLLAGFNGYLVDGKPGAIVFVKFIDSGAPEELLFAHHRAVIIQELFQSISLGLDVSVQTNPKSVREERRTDFIFDGKINETNIQRLLEISPSKLCRLDIYSLRVFSEIDAISELTEPQLKSNLLEQQNSLSIGMDSLTDFYPEFIEPNC